MTTIELPEDGFAGVEPPGPGVDGNDQAGRSGTGVVVIRHKRVAADNLTEPLPSEQRFTLLCCLGITMD